jgi:hypothetical protein
MSRQDVYDFLESRTVKSSTDDARQQRQATDVG